MKPFVLTLSAVVLLAWFWVGMPTSMTARHSEIEDVDEISVGELVARTGHTAKDGEKYSIYIKKREDAPSHADGDAPEPDEFYTELELALIEDFRNLKGDPCNLEYVDAFATRLETLMFYIADARKKGKTLVPHDKRAHEEAQKVMDDAFFGKYLIQSDFTKEMLDLIPYNNMVREACEG